MHVSVCVYVSVFVCPRGCVGGCGVTRQLTRAFVRDVGRYYGTLPRTDNGK